MPHLCPQRGCSGIFHLENEPPGTTVTCRKCGSTLVLTEDGLRLQSGGSTPAPEKPQQSPLSQPLETSVHAEERPSMSSGRGEDRLSNLPSILFGVGSVIVILFLFLPLIDWARYARKDALIKTGDMRESRKDGGGDDGSLSPFPKRTATRTTDGGAKDREDKPEGDSDKRAEERKAWAKERKKHAEDLADLRLASQRSGVFYTIGMLLGFLLLAIASVMYLAPHQTRAHKVVGGIVLTTEILLIFITYMLRSSIQSSVSSLL